MVASRPWQASRVIVLLFARKPAAHTGCLTVKRKGRIMTSSVPDQRGRFGAYGGRYVPETLMFALRQLSEHFEQARQDPVFQKEFENHLRHYVGRPSPLYFAERLT